MYQQETDNRKTKWVKWFGLIGAVAAAAASALNGNIVEAAGIISAALTSASVFKA